ncbi:hypothetical protein Cgig2_022763 [Carnegiea gigantea]|uniref:Uncharacterized protein n=1 Tax=Carnegiea gigantea TaxID=171969 RepID=A0A9Q1QG46_9CARY|nr:hypothetical protein Cgig2_022763 [Carnegiea gigantea]
MPPVNLLGIQMLCKVDSKKEGMGTNPTVRQLGQCLKLQKGKYGRDIRVFQISKASQSPPEMANSEESDEFFELTLDNCYHLMATKKEGKYLKTRKSEKVLARPELPYYLYTTPPKKQIKGISQNISAAGLFLVQLCISHMTYQKRMKLIQVSSFKKM